MLISYAYGIIVSWWDLNPSYRSRSDFYRNKSYVTSIYQISCRAEYSILYIKYKYFKSLLYVLLRDITSDQSLSTLLNFFIVP